MFRLEKVFQNDDSGYVFYVSFIKSLTLLITIYLFSILNKNTIYDIGNFYIYKNSEYYLYSLILSLIFFLNTFYFTNRQVYMQNFISFVKQDIFNFIASNVMTFFIFFILKINFELGIEFLFLLLTIFIIFSLEKIYFNNLYKKLIDKNIIQKNIMLVGTYPEIKKILFEKFEKIYVFKCCIVTDVVNYDLRLIKSEIKFPIFKENEDIRSILEYHSLGQIWILNGDDQDKKFIFNQIIKFSVDTLNIKLDKIENLTGQKLLGNKFKFEFYEQSRFFGISLFLKIILDKFLSIIFLTIASPFLFISSILIYLEDGFPIMFTQNRTGWDGRRFKIYKLRSLKKANFDKTRQVIKDDERLLKIGKLIRRYSIDEVPQFFNVLNGDMSIVGPRPHMVEHDIHYSNLFNNFLKRHKCNPGLTGWAQVNGLRGATPKADIMKRRMEFDLWYLNNWSLLLDIYIIFKTFYALIRYKGD